MHVGIGVAVAAMTVGVAVVVCECCYADEVHKEASNRNKLQWRRKG